MPQTMPGALVGRALGAYGKKPKIPKLGEIDPAKVQLDTVAGNMGVLDTAGALAGATNKLNVNNLKALFEQALPGQYGLAQENTLSLLKGQVPQDVQDAIQRTIAARTLGNAGYGNAGGQFGDFSQARQLGLTSLQLQQQGLNQFGALQSMFPRLDVSSMFFSPQQRLSFAFEDRAAHFQRNLLFEQVKAAPNPADVALAEGLDNDFAAFRQMILSYAGGMMGGGGGGAPSAPSGGGAPSGGYTPAMAPAGNTGGLTAYGGQWAAMGGMKGGFGPG